MSRESALKVLLVVVGLIFLFAVYPLMMYMWPSGWRWQPNQPEYEQMILGVYATLGIFLLLASRKRTAGVAATRRKAREQGKHALDVPRTRPRYGSQILLDRE